MWRKILATPSVGEHRNRSEVWGKNVSSRQNVFFSMKHLSSFLLERLQELIWKGGRQESQLSHIQGDLLVSPPTPIPTRAKKEQDTKTIVKECLQLRVSTMPLNEKLSVSLSSNYTALSPST